MSPETEHLHLEAADTLVNVRDRLSGLRGLRVLLIWPEEGRNLRRKLDLVLIQREAYRRAIQLAIVVKDTKLSFYASELNISCFESIEASERERWKRGRHKVFLPRYHKPSADLLAEDLEFIASRFPRHRQHSPWRAAFERFVVLALLTSVVAVALYTVVPGAVVTVSLQEEIIAVVIDIVADRKADTIKAERSVIPAQIIRETVETTATLPTTGVFWLDSVSASGIVTFTNLGASRVYIPRGTVLGTSAGEPILFETVADVLVPAGSGQRVDATVKAMNSNLGSIGNVDSGKINTVLGGLAEQVSVINLSSAAGGNNLSVKTVDSEDQSKLLASVRIQLQSLAFEKMRAALSESQVLIIESIAIDEERKEWTSFSADVGTMTSELSLTMRAVVSALAVDDRYGRQLVLARLKEKVPNEKELLIESLAYTRGPFKLGRANGQINVTATGSATVIAKLELNQLREQLAGTTLQEARELLVAQNEISVANPPQIKLFPQALQRMPTLAVRIDVQVRDLQ